MTTALYFSQVRLKRDASVKALLPLLLGGDKGGDKGSQHPGHHLVWSLFAEGSRERRDFLWREEERRGGFWILSERIPCDRHGLFDIREPKPFAPALAEGDRLRFSLRANPVVRRRQRAGGRSVKHDIVMDALCEHPSGERAERRFDAMRERGFAWLERQGAGAGFSVAGDDVRIDGYRQHRVARKASEKAMAFSTLDFDGVLSVRDPAAFLAGVARGFGAAKAYGCGLMLIRRA